MIALPAPIATRRPIVIPSGVEGRPLSAASEENGEAPVDAALAEALAKVKTPEDDAIAQQQAAFDRMMQLRAENLREANAIREFGLAQAKKEDEFMQAFIRMI